MLSRVDRLLRRFVNLLHKHLRLTQMRRMSRITSLNSRFRVSREHFLKLRRCGLIIFADEIGGRHITPGSTSDLCGLDCVRLSDQSGGP